ncbi:Putative serine/threonine-protein kinase, active [Septoria linicola]|uniref:non-specific serine/threonine protein kinase n=1 Tax=Septoria linicola TaxID=215465 RepID=A0A9Q9EGE8_9PEZI|nr:putative serine/threonine-protein kinase, active [Septoria linicola]USW48722.1 Putative serine/threonine-protein kinase, active [Septoria linicola]
MADRYRTSRLAARRQPLLELKNKTNTPPVNNRHVKYGKADTSSSLPHNESLEPNGTLAVRSGGRPMSPENKRVSQIASDDARDSKRNSAVSTTSTASGVKRKTYIGHWQLGKTIGKGGCSRVRVVRHRNREQLGAVKIITRTTAESTRAQSLANLIESTKISPGLAASGYKPIPYGLEREIAVMKLLEHPNIVQLYDVWENRNELYLIMEYVDGGELFHYVDERKGLPEDETVFIFRQIVSALLYCHRLLICHRDLKPENILLDRETLSVKLIDFGMAALQPKGRMLSTPCGSPHYAAPEVVSSKPYDGPQADVWSCGVILYVMLTGTTPFNYDDTSGDIRSLFRKIQLARYLMPTNLSYEAQDLIQRIFVTDPRKRLTMDEVWDHPFLHKFDHEFGFKGYEGTKEAAVGKPPQIDEWRVKRIQDIDREILSNMRTLWHSEPEQSLIQKLLDRRELNQEKLFYAALLKHKEETLESYEEGADDISYSASDYHHSRPPCDGDAPPMPSSAQRSQSQYSIMNDEHLRPSSSFAAPPPSESSYDPYRASRDPLISAQGEYMNVTVHRNGTTSTRKGSMGRNLRHPNSTRIETLKHAHRRKSTTSSSLPRSGRSRSSLQRSSMSRHSLAGSLLPSSPPMMPTMRPSDVHKRGVSFGHIRRVSTTSALTAQTSTEGSMPPTPSLPAHLREHHARLIAKEKHVANSSPLAHADQPIKSRKERSTTTKLETPRIRVRKPDTPGHYMRNDIRKHSAELEKACEEAFFRDSLGSNTTARSSLTDTASPYETPPSSVAAKSSGTPDLPSAMKKTRRPLPDLPKDTPNSYLSKTIEETRTKLAAYKANGEDNTAKFDEVMRALDNILPAAGSTPDKRIVSAPEAGKQVDQYGFLPIISEEGSSDQRSSREGANWHRSVTAPVTKDRKPQEKTIRVVSPTSPGAVAPLSIIKRNNGSPASDDTIRRVAAKGSADSLYRRQKNVDQSGLMSIDEHSALGTPSMVRKKKSGWFSRNKKDDETLNGQTLVNVDLKDERRKSSAMSKTTPGSPGELAVPGHTEDNVRKVRFAGGKKGFSKWLSKMGREKGLDNSLVNDMDTTMLTNASLDSLFSSASPAPSSNDNPPSTGPERSWFARFFNIKPVTHVLCFEIGRGKVRQELVMLFKEWERHGVRDLQYSRETNTIFARVDKVNTLDIKPVTFRIELFIVLDGGRKANLSIARFTQVKGAASGFRQVIDVVDGVMRGRGWLVQDEDKWRALCEVIEGPYV